LLGAGPAAVCAMQAALSAKFAAPFVELLLRSMFSQSSLADAFNRARRLAHLQSMFDGSTGWAVPLLFVNAESLDSDLSLRKAVETYLEAERQARSFPSPVQPYVVRAMVDDWLDRTFEAAVGLAFLEAPESCGVTTTLAAAAQRRWQRLQDVT